MPNQGAQQRHQGWSPDRADARRLALGVAQASGLDEIIAADTTLSDVDGEAGRLTIRGYGLDELAGVWSFEEVVHLLFEELFHPMPDEKLLKRALGEARVDVFARCLPSLASLARLDVYDGVRAGIALMPDGDDLECALRLLAAPGVLAPALVRLTRGQELVEPEATGSHATDVVRMLTGDSPSPALAGALDAYFVTVCDHGLNASTFASRVVASTRAGLTSAVLAGLSALKGPLHGGAPGPVIAMLDAIAAYGDAREWLRLSIARGERLMGFGHRIYRVRDPRADALKAVLRRLDARGAMRARLALAEEVEQAALDTLRALKPGRSIETNVEFYTALVLEAVGFPASAFTCVFAMSRVSGWIAHAREQRMTGRLIRPRSRYVGPIAAT